MTAATPQVRFFALVEITESCWLWTGYITVDGYGQARNGKRMVLAHRFAYELFAGPVPEGLELDHLCRNRGCVNPAHLEPVTHRENTLRGDTVTARNAAKTHCPQGHPYDYRDQAGRRRCLACRRERNRINMRAQRARQKTEALP